ncbi:MAG: putative lipid II flippase FtsW [Patescibacteria group bacterium]|nr:putative lipid II flippase FtsW [Patescibacteria group bacterium]MDE2437880.1 putative lipid II flippase FtsW [Patescibacteria group bacterium]
MKQHQPDYVFIVTVVVLVVFGLAMLLSASSILGKQQFNDAYYYFKHQLVSLGIGIALFFITYLSPYHFFRKISPYALLVNIILLALVFTPLGRSAGGASRWLHLGPLTFQPAELLKFSFIVYVAAFFGARGKKMRKGREGFLTLLVVIGVIAALLLKQPATGIFALIVATVMGMYFVEGARLRYILFTCMLVGLAIALLVLVTPYRKARLMTYLNPGVDVQGTGYHINQALIALGSGGMFGIGFGNSRAKASYLPEPIDDSIFALIAEELGFVGATVLIGLLLLLLVRGFAIARDAPDTFSQLATVGMVSVVVLQGFINIGSISGLLPITGLPMPFVSYGGTYLIVVMACMGFIANISRHTV